jgi:hypothetical protein
LVLDTSLVTRKRHSKGPWRKATKILSSLHKTGVSFPRSPWKNSLLLLTYKQFFARMNPNNPERLTPEMWVRSLQYSVNDWDITTCRTYLGLNPKLQDLLARPSNIKVTKVKSEAANHLIRLVLRTKYPYDGRVSTRDFDNLVINTLNMEIKMLQQLTGTRLSFMHLKAPQNFHDDIAALFVQTTHLQRLILEQQAQKTTAQAPTEAVQTEVCNTDTATATDTQKSNADPAAT